MLRCIMGKNALGELSQDMIRILGDFFRILIRIFRFNIFFLLRDAIFRETLQTAN